MRDKKFSRKDTTTYLDGACGDVAIMRHSSGKWWAIIEGERWFVLGQFELLLECFDIFPVLEDFLFLLGEVRPFRHYRVNIIIS